AVAYNPVEVLKTNVLGTQNVIEASVACGVRSVVVVSSDKAVEPSNVYGSSKNVAEHLAVSSNVYAVPQGTRVSVVRYGNVAWSRGSVLWTWADQSAQRYLQITDKRMTRFWLTLDRAVDLIEVALKYAAAGEILAPALHAASMVDIASALVQGDCVINEIGLRPGGEKLHEVLIGTEEASRTHQENGLFFIQPHLPTWGHEKLVYNMATRYSSDMAPRMTQEEIMALLASKPV
ncbi:MAG TPA: polysaccharide biosynthesis protein, partial [Gemmatimonadales bacterium]|nr:polysaccharide biosynthesis protein [Gemmatimonadales bacterium]